jgi:RNA recognition motif-containing protein
MKKIYVGNLAWAASEDDLRDLFSTVGPVLSVAVVTDRETGRSRGFGFVEMEDADAKNAIARLDGRELKGRSLRVNEAMERGSGDRRPREFSERRSRDY